jgi:hypothetical protein
MTQIELTPGLEVEKIIQQAQEGDVVLMRAGHAVALLSDFDDEDLYWYGRERDPQFLASLAKAREQVANGQTVSHEELKKQLGID